MKGRLTSRLQHVETLCGHSSPIGKPAVSEPGFHPWLREVSPTWNWDWPHLRVVQDRLEAITSGRINRLMLFLPPRHGKSECATVRYSAYRLERQPDLRVIIGAYSQTLAHLILIDDPVKSREEADSPAYRDRVWEWYTDDLYTRQEPGSAIVLTLTRWRQDDLAGRILASEDGPSWTVVRLPALAETQEERDRWAERLGDRVGEPDPLGRQPGRALCPERYDEAALARIGRVLGHSFAALFQQRPLPSEGGLFRREWFQPVDRSPEGLRWVRFWDCAAKTGQRNDYTAGALMARSSNGNWYLRNVTRGRWEYPDAKRVILQTAAADGRSTSVGIEDSANGTAILQDLRRDSAAAGFSFWPVRVSADKAVRAGAWASLAHGGLVYLVSGAWISAFLEEVETFPAGIHDDQVDAVSGAYEMIVRRFGAAPSPMESIPGYEGPSTFAPVRW